MKYLRWYIYTSEINILGNRLALVSKVTIWLLWKLQNRMNIPMCEHYMSFRIHKSETLSILSLSSTESVLFAFLGMWRLLE